MGSYDLIFEVYGVTILESCGRSCSTLVDHGRPWSTLVEHGRPWSTVVDYGRPWSTMDVHRPWSTMIDHGRHWSTMVDNGRPWSTMNSFGWPAARIRRAVAPTIVHEQPSLILRLFEERSVGISVCRSFCVCKVVRTRVLAQMQQRCCCCTCASTRAISFSYFYELDQPRQFSAHGAALQPVRRSIIAEALSKLDNERH